MRKMVGLVVSITLVLVYSIPGRAFIPVLERPAGDYVAILSGEEAVPPQETPATGRVTFWFAEDYSALFYRLEVYDITDVLMVHLRQGRPGRWGPVLAWLFPAAPPPAPLRYPGRFSGVLVERALTAQELVGPFAGRTLQDVREEMDLGRAFVQVDTLIRQIGEIRGQVQPVWVWPEEEKSEPVEGR
ncbi:MAG TPA: CHRD domain-containing protein [Atribacteraceae bacterium]|nr:CHRD domain-containing protein [Atribacteraceae bacterium]